MGDVEIIQDVTIEPVTLATVKNFCRIDLDDDSQDDVLTILLATSREQIEKATGLSLAPKTLQYTTRDTCVELPYGVIRDVLEVKYGDDILTLDDDYRISGGDFKTVYVGAENFSFFYPINGGLPIVEPIGNVYRNGVVTIKYEAGYTMETLPQSLRHLILRLTDYYYANRGQAVGIMPKDIQQEVRLYSRQNLL